MAKKSKATRPSRPGMTNAELLAMSRMLRLYLQNEKFFNPVRAFETEKLAETAMGKIEAWRRRG